MKTQTISTVALLFLSLNNAYAQQRALGIYSHANVEKYNTQTNEAYVAKDKYKEAKKTYLERLKSNPNNVSDRVALADVYLKAHRDRKALEVIQYGLNLEPNNVTLLLKKAEILTVLHIYTLAIQDYNHVLAIDPKNKPAKGYKEDVVAINPHNAYGPNEIGISTDNAYVSDVRKNWDLSSIYYTRDTYYGQLTGRVNSASRLGLSAPQYEIDFSPIINRNIYLDLVTAYSSQPALFPKILVGAQGYALVTKKIQLSAGAKYSSLGNTYFTTYTGSVNYYQGPYLLTFRPNVFVPLNHNNSVLYTGVIRRYFNTDDHYISVSFGSGKSPDLADLQTVDFIVIKNSFVGLNYEFPIFKHSVVVDLGVGYQHWKYPSGLLRELYDGSVGLKYRF